MLLLETECISQDVCRICITVRVRRRANNRFDVLQLMVKRSTSLNSILQRGTRVSFTVCTTVPCSAYDCACGRAAPSTHQETGAKSFVFVDACVIFTSKRNMADA